MTHPCNAPCGMQPPPALVARFQHEGLCFRSSERGVCQSKPRTSFRLQPQTVAAPAHAQAHAGTVRKHANSPTSVCACTYAFGMNERQGMQQRQDNALQVSSNEFNTSKADRCNDRSLKACSKLSARDEPSPRPFAAPGWRSGQIPARSPLPPAGPLPRPTSLILPVPCTAGALRLPILWPEPPAELACCLFPSRAFCGASTCCLSSLPPACFFVVAPPRRTCLPPCLLEAEAVDGAEEAWAASEVLVFVTEVLSFAAETLVGRGDEGSGVIANGSGHSNSQLSVATAVVGSMRTGTPAGWVSTTTIFCLTCPNDTHEQLQCKIRTTIAISDVIAEPSK